MRKRLRLPFLHRLLLTWLVTLLLPVALIGQQTWNGYQKTLEQEIIQTNSQMLAEIASVINLKMRELEQIAVNIDVNQDLRPFAVTATPYGAVQAIQSLAQYRSTNSFIYEIGYYIRGRDYLYTSTAAYRTGQFLDSFYEQENLSDAEMRDFLENSRLPVIWPSAQTVLVRTGIQLMTCVYPIPVTGEPYATAVFFIEEAQISSMLASIFSRKSDSIFMLNSQGDVILSLTDGRNVPDFAAMIAFVEQTGQNRGRTPLSSVMTIDGTETVVTYLDGGYRGLQFLSLSPLDEVMAPALHQQRRFFLTLGVVAVAGILIILLSMTFTYNPLRSLFRKVRAYQDNPLKTDNEFSLIGQMLDRMQQDNQRLQQILQENESDVRLAFLTDLLNGLVEDDEQLEQRSLTAGVNLNGTAFAALSVLVEGSGSFESLFQNLPDDVLAFASCRLHALRSTGDRAVPVLAVLDDADPAHYAHCIGQLQKTAAAGGLLITIGAGNLVTDPLQLGRSWQQAGEALSYRFVAGKGTVIFYSDMTWEQRVLPWYPNQEIDALIRGIMNGQTDEISRAVESVTRQIREQNLGIFAARCLSYDLINTVVRVVVSQNIRTDVIEEQLRDMISLPQTETIQQLGAYLTDFSTRLSEQLGKTRDSRLDKILLYLDNHYRDSAFSVYNMAADLNISYSYLNRLFNNHTGQSVLDYLTDKRMEWVKQQLRETAQPIRQIIIDAGYNDIPNFSRKFKQREGISPRQYREQHSPPGDQVNR